MSHNAISSWGRIILIDNYVDEDTLQLFSGKHGKVTVMIYTRQINPKLLLAKGKFIQQLGSLKTYLF